MANGLEQFLLLVYILINSLGVTLYSSRCAVKFLLRKNAYLIHQFWVLQQKLSTYVQEVDQTSASPILLKNRRVRVHSWCRHPKCEVLKEQGYFWPLVLCMRGSLILNRTFSHIPFEWMHRKVQIEKNSREYEARIHDQPTSQNHCFNDQISKYISTPHYLPRPYIFLGSTCWN